MQDSEHKICCAGQRELVSLSRQDLSDVLADEKDFLCTVYGPTGDSNARQRT